MQKQHLLIPGRFNKKIVLDTSTLLYDALSFNTFKSSDIYIPFSVLEEIDHFKRDMGEKGRNARQFNRFVDLLRQKGSLTKGIQLENDSYLYVCMNVPMTSPELSLSKVDHRILATALYIQNCYSSAKVKLVTKDINLRIKADVFGIEAIDYDLSPGTDVEDLYTGIRHWSISEQEMEIFKSKKILDVDNKVTKFYPNQYIIMKQDTEKIMGRFTAKTNQIHTIYQPQEPTWGIHPRNMEQHFALDALMQDDFKLVSLLGKAGTGKTLLALAVGLYKTLDESRFHKLLVSRPVFPMGRDIGYLPGDIEQKLNPWMQPVFDSLEFLMGLGKKASRIGSGSNESRTD